MQNYTHASVTKMQSVEMAKATTTKKEILESFNQGFNRMTLIQPNFVTE